MKRQESRKPTCEDCGSEDPNKLKNLLRQFDICPDHEHLCIDWCVSCDKQVCCCTCETSGDSWDLISEKPIPEHADVLLMYGDGTVERRKKRDRNTDV